MNFTIEQYNRLWDAEIHFKSAVKSGCVKNCPRWLVDTVADVYEEATGEVVNRNFNCAVCVFNFLNKVGKLYFADMEEYKNQEDMITEIPIVEKEMITEIPVIEKEIIDERPKRRGRPKKDKED